MKYKKTIPAATLLLLSLMGYGVSEETIGMSSEARTTSARTNSAEAISAKAHRAAACALPNNIVGERCTLESISSEIGSFKRTYQAYTLSGTGAKLVATFSKPAVSGDLLIEIQEIHQRRLRAFGYTVKVNQTDVAFRTYAEHGAGPNHYFIKVPLEALANHGDMTVTLTSAGAPPFSIAKVIVWRDYFTKLEAEEGIYRPMALLGKHTTLAPGQAGFSSFGPLGDFGSSSYANAGTPQTQKKLLNSLTKSGETERPLMFLINGPTWGGAMHGPDGRGGYFNDIRYSLLSYDSSSRSYAASFPNMWSSAFWAAFRDPWMNAEMRRRLAASLQGSNDSIDLLKARGKAPKPAYLREMGPPMGEITASTISAAAKEGLVLDPSDGISEAERAWLFRDGVRIWEEYAATNRELLTRDSVVVDCGKVTLPDDHLLMNQYSHTVFRSEGPMKDRRWFGGQMGIVDGFWSTGELFWDEVVMYDYVKANGKLVHGNLEGTILKGDATPLVKLYAAGFQLVNFFNEPKNVLDDVRLADGCESKPLPSPIHHEPTVFSVSYNHTAKMGATVSFDNIGIHSQPRENADSMTAARLAVLDVTRPGQVTYRIDNGGEAFASGFSLHLDGRISAGENNRMVVLLGDSPETLRPVATITAKDLPCPNHWTPFMTSSTTVDLGAAMVGKKEQFMRLELHAAGAPDATFLLEIAIGTQWPLKTGVLANNNMTLREARSTQLWIQDRAVAQTYIDRCAENNVDVQTATLARQLFEAGRYRSVQNFLAGALAEVLPARYAVRGHGTLGKYPVEVRLPQDDQAVIVTLHRVGIDGCEFSLATDMDRQALELSVAAGPWTNWTLANLSRNRFRLAVADVGTPAVVANGRAMARVEADKVKPVVRKLPKTIIARCGDWNKHQIRIDCQDPVIMGTEESVTLPVSDKVIYKRSAEREADSEARGSVPRPQDRVELSLNEEGQVTAVNAIYGIDSGIISKVTAPNPIGPEFSNGAITLDNGNSYEFSYGTKLDTVAMHGRYADYETRHIAEGLRSGQRVTLHYSPYAEMGTTRRLIQVTQSNMVLMQEDYYKQGDDSWKNRAVSVDGLAVTEHKPEPNYLHDASANLLRPTQHFVPGSIVYRIKSDHALKSTVVEFQARSFEDSSTVDFAVSCDEGVTWVNCGRFGNNWQNSYPQFAKAFSKMPWQYIDLTKSVAGYKNFLLKATLKVNSADERFCVSAIRVVTEKP